jgi:hypothetical protein
MTRLAALAALVGLCAPAFASSPLPDLSEAASAPPAAHASAIGGSRYDYDCVDVSFGASDPAASGAVTLRSQEWVTECVPVGGDPRRGGGGQQCWERPGFSYSRTVQVERLDAKPLLPWERDVFRVCLQGPWLDSRVQSAAYRYRLVDDGRLGRIAYQAGEKVATRPDPAGLSIAALTPALSLTLNDRWASYYAGEAVKVHVELKKDAFLSPTVSEFDLTMPTAQSYTLDLGRQAGSAVKAGKKYFARLSFQRVGAVSNADRVKLGDTAKVEYRPASLTGVGR